MRWREASATATAAERAQASGVPWGRALAPLASSSATPFQASAAGAWGDRRGEATRFRQGFRGVQRGKILRVRSQPWRCVVQYMRGTNVQNAGVTDVVNTQDFQEQAPCATYWLLGVIQVPHEAGARGG
eukprot:1175549-Prorocentrum_minimum.AAC.3